MIQIALREPLVEPFKLSDRTIYRQEMMSPSILPPGRMTQQGSHPSSHFPVTGEFVFDRGNDDVECFSDAYISVVSSDFPFLQRVKTD